MRKMRNLLHFSTVDVDEGQVAGIGVIPMPTGPARVRLFLDGGGVIDLQESREQARDIWLEKESKDERYSRLVEENAKLRSIFDRVNAQALSLNGDRPVADIMQVIDTMKRALKEVL